MKERRYEVFMQLGDEFNATPETVLHQKLPSGSYQVRYDSRFNIVTFIKMSITSDKLVDIPDSQYDDVIGDMDMFLSPECEARFREVDFLYKGNILLYGVPGGGKTCIVNKVAQKFEQRGGIVLFNPPLAGIPEIYRILNAIQKETQVLIIMEEFDQAVKGGEEALCVILDGQIQKESVLFIATTNFIEKIPARLRRPGRFPTVIEVKPPTANARRAYLRSKFRDEQLIGKIVAGTSGFTIDELKEVVRSVYCMRKDLDTTIKRIRAIKGEAKEEADDDREPPLCKKCGYYDDECECPPNLSLGMGIED